MGAFGPPPAGGPDDEELHQRFRAQIVAERIIVYAGFQAKEMVHARCPECYQWSTTDLIENVARGACLHLMRQHNRLWTMLEARFTDTDDDEKVSPYHTQTDEQKAELFEAMMQGTLASPDALLEKLFPVLRQRRSE